MSGFALKKNGLAPRKGPVVLVVLDGIGWGKKDAGDAVFLARTPTLDRLWADHPTLMLKAHGTAVGLPSDADMGNSEVGHNALGAGRIFDQGAKLVENALADEVLYASDAWKKATSRAQRGGTIHFIGLLSDGNVHSHIDHLLAMLRRCRRDGVARARVHVLLDGRDVAATSSLSYVETLESCLSELRDADHDYRIASGGGRMLVTMDRYEADWRIVERGWQAHVLGRGPRFSSARAAIEAAREAEPEISDQFLPPFVVVEDGQPVGTVEDGDAVLLFNFRGDRAIELSRAFEDAELSAFDRVRRPDVFFAGMMQYDGDLQLPKNYLVAPPSIDRTLGEYLAHNNLRQYACSETQKFGHVTYFFNGNRSGMFDPARERYEEIPSDRVPFEQRPWMKAAEITDATLAALRAGEFDFLRVNYANGDMVGHSGDLVATIVAVEAVDLSLGRLLRGVAAAGGVAVITADHGNADQMVALDKQGEPVVEGGRPKPLTSHTLNAVPLTIYHPTAQSSYRWAAVGEPGLGNVAATLLGLLGFEAPEGYLPALIR
ncbi:MAG: 2,3-bisphosphoglycerate-independent phosphoglycerate mutase [Deltaproteobacteria bacterium]|nr:2,3-bisphosphoglycerate-independent phosphoglycerate mutase [Deltaproteobacteria bacterium]